VQQHFYYQHFQITDGALTNYFKYLKNKIMNTSILHYIVKSQQTEWQPLIEKGIHYEGIFVKSLRFDPEKQRSTTILLKFEAGANYPYHNHPAGEEIFVLEGEAIIEGATLQQGDYLYTPPTFKHSVKTLTGCIMLFVVPEEIEILSSKK
jgi:quercetin dioxygenase-like cupin family protein